MRMTISLSHDGTVVAQARADGPSGMVGDVALEVVPGQTVAGIPYDLWRSHAGATVELKHLLQEAGAFARG